MFGILTPYLQLGLIFVPLDVGRGVAVSQALQGQVFINWHRQCPDIPRAEEGWWD